MEKYSGHLSKNRWAYDMTYEPPHAVLLVGLTPMLKMKNETKLAKI